MAESWNPYDILPTITQKTVEWISKQKKEQPFFAYLAFNSPHYPIVPNKPYHGKSKAGYYGDFVIETDAMVGKVMNALKKHGFAENTLVVFSADNGPETHAFERLEEFKQWSSGKYRGVKRDIYEGGHRVPFIVKWPGKIKPGSVSDEVVSQVDLAASFAKIIGHRLGKKEQLTATIYYPSSRGRSTTSPCAWRPCRTPLRKVRPTARGLGLYQCSNRRSQEGKSRLPEAFRPQGIRERSWKACCST